MILKEVLIVVSSEDGRKPLGIYFCPFCNEEYKSLDEVRVVGEKSSDIVPDETVTCVVCSNCGKSFDWEDHEYWS